MMRKAGVLLLALLGAALTWPVAGVAHREAKRQGHRHVLLISVDGLHASDLTSYVAAHPDSTLARLETRGTTYRQAHAPVITDSFPGLLALVAGGTPRSTGVYYDNSYDRTLYAPGSNCTGPAGTNVLYDESIDVNPGDVNSGGIDPAKLPRVKAGGQCLPLYPHSFLRVNTIFNVAHDAGLRTAWSDKHPAYDLVNGHPGHGVDDLYTPEVGASVGGQSITGSVVLTEQNDALKVHAVLNQVGGHDSSGSQTASVPAIFGMNFQAVSVAEKLPFNGSSHVGGYQPGGTAFTPQLAGALDFVDAQLGQFVAALASSHLLRSTEIIVTAKHGQSPIDPSQHVRVDEGVVPGILTARGIGVAQATQDDAALLWLADQSQAGAAASALRADRSGANTGHIRRVIAGQRLAELFGNPLTDPRVPDVLIEPQHGVVYSLSTKKVAEHGGAAGDDRHVALLVVRPGGAGGRSNGEPVSTTSVAPTILDFLGLQPAALQSVQAESTPTLPAEH
jgi:type I phosphodiesterase/nucleotide pyrophosphatase